MRTGVAEARAALAVGSKSFALVGKLLPQGVRDDAAVVYAYCRRADDLIDDAPSPAVAATALARLRQELAALYAGVPQREPRLTAFQEVVLRRQIPREVVDELLEGFAMDARATPIVYETWEQLRLYCFRVAGTVGLMMCRVMGVQDPRAHEHAAALGMAMQLTNIARDVSEDWQRGRLYLPRELLAVPLVPGGALTPEATAALNRGLPVLLAAAEPLYRRGDAGLPALDTRSAIAVRAARLIYSAIGAVLKARRHDVTGPRAVVPRWRKLLFALAAAGEILFARWRPATNRALPHGRAS
jgi:phytoene synthase